jgi:Fe2+-dicitrate sensor, membrane component
MKVNRNTLVRYFLGQCSEKEKEAIHEWLEEDDAHKKEFIRERIHFDASLMIEEEELLRPAQPDPRRKRWAAVKIAAAVLILIGSSFFFQFYISRPPATTVQNVYVPSGSRTSLTLPDGTLVWLNSNSTLSYPNAFTNNRRIVELDGEGYFEVTADKQKPFIVKTDKYNVEVLGTTFNLEAYTAEPTFKTALFSGKVRVYKEMQEDESLYLNAGEAAELVNGHLLVTRANSNSYRWKDGLIILEGQSFREIMHLFEKYYDLQIIIRNEKVTELGYEGKLRIADGIDHALRVLQNDFRFTYHREPETNILYIY